MPARKAKSKKPTTKWERLHRKFNGRFRGDRWRRTRPFRKARTTLGALPYNSTVPHAGSLMDPYGGNTIDQRRIPLGTRMAGGTDPVLLKMYELMQNFRQDFKTQNRPAKGKTGAVQQDKPENNQTEYPVNVRPEDAAALRDRDEAQNPFEVRKTDLLPRRRPIPVDDNRTGAEIGGPLGSMNDILDEIHNSVAPNEDTHITHNTPDAPPPPPPEPSAPDRPDYQDDLDLPDGGGAAAAKPKGKGKLTPVPDEGTSNPAPEDTDAWSADAAAATQVQAPVQTINQATGVPAQPMDQDEPEVPVASIIRRGHTLDDLIHQGGLDDATANTIRQDAADGQITKASINTMTQAIAHRQNSHKFDVMPFRNRPGSFEQRKDPLPVPTPVPPPAAPPTSLPQNNRGSNVHTYTGSTPNQNNGGGARSAPLPVPTAVPPAVPEDPSILGKRTRNQDPTTDSVKRPNLAEDQSVLGKRTRNQDPTTNSIKRPRLAPPHEALHAEATQAQAHGDIAIPAPPQTHDDAYENEHLANHDVLADAGINDYTYSTGGGGAARANEDAEDLRRYNDMQHLANSVGSGV